MQPRYLKSNLKIPYSCTECYNTNWCVLYTNLSISIVNMVHTTNLCHTIAGPPSVVGSQGNSIGNSMIISQHSSLIGGQEDRKTS